MLSAVLPPRPRLCGVRAASPRDQHHHRRAYIILKSIITRYLIRPPYVRCLLDALGVTDVMPDGDDGMMAVCRHADDAWKSVVVARAWRRYMASLQMKMQNSSAHVKRLLARAQAAHEK